MAPTGRSHVERARERAKPTRGRPFRRGRDPRRGDPQTAGKASGRVRAEWQQHWREYFDSDEGRQLVARRARRSDKLLIRLLEYGFGRPPDEVRLNANVEHAGAVLVVGGDEEAYVAALRRMRETDPALS